jgi:hypothetical protein
MLPPVPPFRFLVRFRWSPRAAAAASSAAAAPSCSSSEATRAPRKELTRLVMIRQWQPHGAILPGGFPRTILQPIRPFVRQSASPSSQSASPSPLLNPFSHRRLLVWGKSRGFCCLDSIIWLPTSLPLSLYLSRLAAFSPDTLAQRFLQRFSRRQYFASMICPRDKLFLFSGQRRPDVS